MEKIIAIAAPETSNLNPILANGNKPMTNFWECFNEIEEKLKDFDNSVLITNIEKNAERMFKVAKKQGYKYVTELYIILNWRIWYWHGKGNDEIGKCYDALWRKVGSYVDKNFKTNEECEYFFKMTD